MVEVAGVFLMLLLPIAAGRVVFLEGKVVEEVMKWWSRDCKGMLGEMVLTVQRVRF